MIRSQSRSPCGLVVKTLVAKSRAHGFESHREQKLIFQNFQILFNFKNCNELLILKSKIFDDIKLLSSALWLYEFKFQMVSGYSTLVQFQSGTRNFVLYTIANLLFISIVPRAFNKVSQTFLKNLAELQMSRIRAG